jgi:formate hydrogenlyase transcriptional activator
LNMGIYEEKEKMWQLSHATVEQSMDGIFWLDLEGRIHRANEAACRMLGYSQSEFLRLSVSKFDPDYPLNRYHALWKKITEVETLTFESRHQRKDGSIYPVEITCNFVQLDDNEYACTFFKDITDRKEKENELCRALKELEELENRLQDENVYLQEEIKISHDYRNMVGHSAAIQEVFGQIQQVATTDANVLILGETGTGKELVARAIHDLSGRRDRPLVKINCATLPDKLIESELFGHEKGAFTDALSKRVGRFELANKGTIFLDEIGDLPLGLQVKLLRVLQEGEFERLGDAKTYHVDVRVISATNQNLERLVEKGEFRKDLFYRLNTFPILCPPLRTRKDDIPDLVKYFVTKSSDKVGKNIESIPKKVIETLTGYHWPGNIRELENVIERAIITSPGRSLTIGDWFAQDSRKETHSSLPSLADNERHHILKALALTKGRISGEKGAATILGINPNTLTSRMKKLGIKRRAKFL